MVSLGQCNIPILYMLNICRMVQSFKSHNKNITKIKSSCILNEFFYPLILYLSMILSWKVHVTTGRGEHKSELSLICQGVCKANVIIYLAVTSVEKALICESARYAVNSEQNITSTLPIV